MKHKTSTKDLQLSSNERLFIESGSVFKPKNYKNFKPQGNKIYTFHAGFKKKYDDLLIIIFDSLVNVECVYSKTSTPSAPIIWDKKHNNGKCKALIVNSGNANAHTGKKGIEIIKHYSNILSKKIKCKKNEILISSTGIIGEIFDPKIIINQINKLHFKDTTHILDAAKAIMTTDTYPKTSVHKLLIDNEIINIYGFAKGSGMIQPNMGTMLAYIFIECKISNLNLKKLLKKNLNSTFNSISVDGDTSTSDTLMLFSLNKKNINLKKQKNFKILSAAIYDIMFNLSQQVIKDGEGLSKLIQANVFKAKSKNQANNIAFSIINSALVKTAIAGQDANWGRIIMAIGKSFEKVNQNKITISFGKNIVCTKGAIYKKIDLKKINRYIKNKIIKINVNLGIGNCSSTAYGNDLNYKYIKINADYRS
ncbi:MAG: Arginine biosynthesis bifunctional protein ArgJ [Alphaproteobacteria bacterium MarineAlpha5_Bin5]|nr:MAG: Arginine biosynthesis bifunctional protein ArgJ [Alphaproteobacteria bacterium MarineAlpha5_Bin5]PPR51309.1 MAG: Arginine biosynthesis bifunctional protein ArgJ [Alphaproteobacteria bacterium MarineAlpha5_Bin4]|tara:strand:+ start:3536 stop:4801 length:1266 start_codon:yes stop_codon:yes gene_type:complete